MSLRILLPSQPYCKFLIKQLLEKGSDVTLMNTTEELMRKSVIMPQERAGIASRLRVTHRRTEVKQDTAKLLVSWGLSFLCTE